MSINSNLGQGRRANGAYGWGPRLHPEAGAFQGEAAQPSKEYVANSSDNIIYTTCILYICVCVLYIYYVFMYIIYMCVCYIYVYIYMCVIYYIYCIYVIYNTYHHISGFLKMDDPQSSP